MIKKIGKYFVIYDYDEGKAVIITEECSNILNKVLYGQIRLHNGKRVEGNFLICRRRELAYTSAEKIEKVGRYIIIILNNNAKVILADEYSTTIITIDQGTNTKYINRVTKTDLDALFEVEPEEEVIKELERIEEKEEKEIAEWE